MAHGGGDQLMIFRRREYLLASCAEPSAELLEAGAHVVRLFLRLVDEHHLLGRAARARHVIIDLRHAPQTAAGEASRSLVVRRSTRAP
jgi:hypothetical protein